MVTTENLSLLSGIVSNSFTFCEQLTFLYVQFKCFGKRRIESIVAWGKYTEIRGKKKQEEEDGIALFVYTRQIF